MTGRDGSDLLPPPLPPPERNAAEGFLLGLAIWEGARAVLTPTISVEVLLGPTWVAIWGVGLLAGGTVALAGLLWPGRVFVGAWLMQVGYAAFAPMCLARGVALLHVGEADMAVVILAFAAVATARLVQIELRLSGRPSPAQWVRRAWRAVSRW